MKSCKSHEKKWNKEHQTLSFQFFTNRFSILMFFVLFFHVVCKISNFNMWTTRRKLLVLSWLYLPHDVVFIRIVTFCSYNTLNFLPNNAGSPEAFKIWSAQVPDLVQNATALTFLCYKVDWIVLFFRSILISGTVEILVFCCYICLGFVRKVFPSVNYLFLLSWEQEHCVEKRL